MPERIQTLLTGFGPFGTVVQNPTERLVRHFACEPVTGLDLTCWVFPTSFERAPEMMRALLEIGGTEGTPFDAVLMLGVATGSPSWRVEQFGRNRDAAITDADGFTPDEREIVPNGPAILPVTLPVEPQIDALQRHECPVVASETAGAYLCNHLLYTTLTRLQDRPTTRAGFLHVPADEQTFAPGMTSAPMFSFSQHVEAVRAVLSTLTI